MVVSALLAASLLDACSSDICDWSQARSLAADAASEAADVPVHAEISRFLIPLLEV